MRELGATGFLTGGAPTGESLTLRVEGECLSIVAMDGRQQAIDPQRLMPSLGGFDGRTLVLSFPLIEGQGELHLRGDDSVAVLARDAPEPLRGRLEALKRDGHRRGRRRALQGAVVVAVLLLAAVGLWRGAALAQAGLVRLVPTGAEAQLGDVVAQSLVAGRRVVTDGPAHAAVQATLERVLVGVGPSPYTFRVQLVDAPEVNAVAAPGGAVVVYTGLLRELQSPEELAGVLAHEVQHVLRRHGLRQLAGQLGLATLAGLVVGDVAGLATLGAQLAGLSYSRGAEEEADAEAVAMLRRSRIDPSGLATFFARQAQKIELPAVLSTHPSSEARLARLPREGEAGAFEPMAIDWAAVQAAVGR